MFYRPLSTNKLKISFDLIQNWPTDQRPQSLLCQISSKQINCLVNVFCPRSGQVIEPLYQVWEESADTELLPPKTSRQVTGINSSYSLQRATAHHCFPEWIQFISSYSIYYSIQHFFCFVIEWWILASLLNPALFEGCFLTLSVLRKTGVSNPSRKKPCVHHVLTNFAVWRLRSVD